MRGRATGDAPPSPTGGRLRPRTGAAWAALVLAVAFAALWVVFAVRAVDRNRDPTPRPVDPAAITPPDLQATYDAAMRRLPLPDYPYLVPDPRSSGSPTATSASPPASPVATSATPAASPPPP